MLNFPCIVEILNRQAVALGKNGRLRAVKSVVSLKKSVTGDVSICIYTAKNLTPHQYSVNAITSIRKAFLREGKVTILISQPEVNLMLREADVAQLGNFVQEIIKNWNNKQVETDAEVREKLAVSESASSSKPAKPSSCLRQPKAKPGNSRASKENPTPAPLEKNEASKIKKTLKTTAYVLKVKRKSDYPLNGFNQNLVEVAMNDIMLKKVDMRLLGLKNLKVLNLSGNKITSIDLLASVNSRLQILILDENRIKAVPEDLFSAKSLESLEYLSINDNELQILPRSILKLGRLNHLSVSKNQLQVLPYNMHFLRSLKSLAVDGNQLTFLPHPLMFMSLNNLDVSSNNLSQPHLPLQREVPRDAFPTLFELTANMIATHNCRNHRLPAKILKVSPDEIPAVACELIHTCKWCTKCGKMSCRYSLRNQRTRSCAASVISDGTFTRSQLPTIAALCEKCTS